MSFSFSFRNAPERVLPQVIEALQRLQYDPHQLSRERDQRFNEPPPPCSESGDTTQPPTPGPAVVDETYQRYQRDRARGKSMPLDQFKSQARREVDRLVDQISGKRYGRRQTLPWDDSCDLRANSENSVRSRWVEQGIWADEWGPAWPSNSHPSMTHATKVDGPFYGAYSPAVSETRLGARWGHEQGNSPSPSPEPEPPRSPGPWIWFTDPPAPKQPTEIPIGEILVRAPRPTVRDPEASRPLTQFLYQVSKEREWIQDEVNYRTPGKVVNLDALAYESVKENWTKDGIWNPKWGELPGHSWTHEESEEPEEPEDPDTPAPKDSRQSSEQPPDAIVEDRLGTRHPNLPTPAPMLHSDEKAGSRSEGPRRSARIAALQGTSRMAL